MNLRARLGVSMIGRTISHYVITEKIGEGGMGVVYRATDTRLHRDVALKLLPDVFASDAIRMARFQREAQLLAALNHPNIASVFGLEEFEGSVALVMELIQGLTLAERIRGGPLLQPELLSIAQQISEGLEAAHQKNIIHRDLKPANVKITPEGRVKILDFGLARSATPTVEVISPEGDTADRGFSRSAAGGTLPYMAPEQLRGEPNDQRTDIYALGAVLYEMATAQRPFPETGAVRLIGDIQHQKPVPPRHLAPDLSSRLEQIILKCLEKDPAHRYQLCSELLADLRRVALSAEASEKTLSVLYFENLSGQKEDEYFRDGITEDITTELSKIRELRVLSRSAVLPFRDKGVTPAQVGQLLGASYVLEGSLRRGGNRLRVTAKFVETQSGHTLWAERYDREMEDVFAIQDEMAHNIARALRVVLSETERRAIDKVPTAHVQAYDFYLRGRQFFHQFRRKGFDFARQMFSRAIEIDPNYARAYAGIADCSAFLYMYWESSEDNLAQADRASQKALDLDPDLAEAHSSRGMTAVLKKNYEESSKEFDIALRLNPRAFEPYYFKARSFYSQGKLEEAVDWFERASLVYPEDYQAPMLKASALHGLNRKAEADAAYRLGLAACIRHLEHHPDDSRALYFGANALSQLGQKLRSMEWAARAAAMEPEEPQVLYNVACVYALLGEQERAIDCLEQSVTHGFGQREWMEHDPDLASLRTHPRFQSLVCRPIGVAGK